MLYASIAREFRANLGQTWLRTIAIEVFAILRQTVVVPLLCLNFGLIITSLALFLSPITCNAQFVFVTTKQSVNECTVRTVLKLICICHCCGNINMSFNEQCGNRVNNLRSCEGKIALKNEKWHKIAHKYVSAVKPDSKCAHSEYERKKNRGPS